MSGNNPEPVSWAGKKLNAEQKKTIIFYLQRHRNERSYLSSPEHQADVREMCKMINHLQELWGAQ